MNQKLHSDKSRSVIQLYWKYAPYLKTLPGIYQNIFKYNTNIYIPISFRIILKKGDKYHFLKWLFDNFIFAYLFAPMSTVNFLFPQSAVKIQFKHIKSIMFENLFILKHDGFKLMSPI